MTVTPDEHAANRQALLNKADSAAYKVLREKYQSEFNEAKTQAAKQLGIDWQPRLSGVDAARKKVADLIAAHPELRAEVMAAVKAEMEDH